ncbi:MAG TPA: hypothetical protein VJC16_00805 [Candidatus Nanoarchaeia archaeon]|nr:hypothetical protein [Candidatus Nanoarchaeia archaeon]
MLENALIRLWLLAGRYLTSYAFFVLMIIVVPVLTASCLAYLIWVTYGTIPSMVFGLCCAALFIPQYRPTYRSFMGFRQGIVPLLNMISLLLRREELTDSALAEMQDAMKAMERRSEEASRG